LLSFAFRLTRTLDSTGFQYGLNCFRHHLTRQALGFAAESGNGVSDFDGQRLLRDDGARIDSRIDAMHANNRDMTVIDCPWNYIHAAVGGKLSGVRIENG
jgi:hypothetical protein